MAGNILCLPYVNLSIVFIPHYTTAITILTKKIASVLCNQIIVGLGGNESKTLAAAAAVLKLKGTTWTYCNIIVAIIR
jgi:hypothetical protein